MFLKILLAILIVITISGLVLYFCNRFLPKWFCTHLGWHQEPKSIGFDGVSLTGICPRCEKSVLQDSQGNWF
jgi:hypothetical protein